MVDEERKRVLKEALHIQQTPEGQRVTLKIGIELPDLGCNFEHHVQRFI